MNLYEINSELLSLIDDETGEITDIEAWNAMLKTGYAKVDDLAKWRRNLKAEQEAISKEIVRLTAMKASRENICTRIDESIKVFLNGEKYKSTVCTIFYKDTPKVDIIDEKLIPEEFFKVERSPMKTAIKKALDAGVEVPGAALGNTHSMIIR